MKSLSSLDIHFLVEELQSLVKARLDKVYQGEGELKGDFTFQLNKAGEGKKLLRYLQPSMLYITPVKPEYGKTPGHFATFLRRHLGNARVQKIEQVAFERIVELTFENKNGFFTLVIELIQPGNMLLLNAERKIISLLTPKKMASRTIRGGAVYEAPPAQFDPKAATEKEIQEKLSVTGMDSVVKAIAVDLGFGGTYAEEICERAKIEKNSKGTKTELVKIAKEVKKILSSTITPCGNGDVYPIKMNARQVTNTFATFSEALASTAPQIEIKKEITKKKDKTATVLEQQKKALAGYMKSAEENQRKGDLIYENYQELDVLLSQLRTARETMSWAEIKKKLKNKRIVKIDEAKGTITVEL